ncbi:hypothetical protein RB25_23990 [Herbaspirillum rubrisubalbicans]|uniref:DUF1146 domain-containing protein n=2 Tax=Herbaspirillum rubrisubalbicans TaxID=80842 RepID=A0AAD0UAA2_9BURK|nr:hypothetical protein [Herbaspirillum rubrisubalbicans]ALU90658.1 Hypothetical protein Hrubri_3501 [Herbaspirillum rubrisubalbicans M1]AYR25698.1 hypothetical protein RC54_18595 [Herbaspirillum rubrisubalbicans]MCP1573989.1 putative membrane protein [Herbaspirillum rubrisubalbicans]NQE51186.1 hypothetical protein [Herbaspirillum rubrisubalbicans]QJQ02531.1 hypothetical protein C798_20575 [Herbaspirillum rubrisubalbicans Os34]
MIDWVPIVFVTFKLLVFITGMFFAIKWHYDQGKKDKGKQMMDTRAVLRTSGLVALVFLLLLLGLWIVTDIVSKMLGLDMTFP